MLYSRKFLPTLSLGASFLCCSFSNLSSMFSSDNASICLCRDWFFSNRAWYSLPPAPLGSAPGWVEVADTLCATTCSMDSSCSVRYLFRTSTSLTETSLARVSSLWSLLTCQRQSIWYIYSCLCVNISYENMGIWINFLITSWVVFWLQDIFLNLKNEYQYLEFYNEILLAI